MFKFICFVFLAFCTKATLGQTTTTLTVVAADPCAAGVQTMPTGGSVVMTCTFTGFTAADVVPASSANDASLEIQAGGTAIYTIAADQTGTTPTVTAANSDTVSAAVNSDNIVITATAFPSAALNDAITCIAKQVVVGTATKADQPASSAVNINTYCTSFTAATYCGSGQPVLTCSLGTITLATWEADATAVLHFRKSGTSKFSLAASNIASAATSGNLDSSAGTWSASATTATLITAMPTTVATADIGADWSCDITGATGAYNGIASSTVTTTTCVAYTLAATCSGTTVSALSIGTPGLTFTAFDLVDTYTITVFKGTEDRYMLTSNTISSAALTGSLDAASGTVVAGTYTVASATATSWTFTPTVAITEADEGSDWRVVVSAGASLSGGSGSVSVTCGAEMNKMAGMFVALLVAIKTLLF